MKPYPCPNCEAIAIKETVTRDDSIREATYQCPAGHLFILKWLQTPLSEGVSVVTSGMMEAQQKTGPAGNRTLTAKTVGGLDG